MNLNRFKYKLICSSFGNFEEIREKVEEEILILECLGLIKRRWH